MDRQQLDVFFGENRENEMICLGALNLGCLPPSICQLKQVRKLSLTHCGINQLPPELGRLQQLEQLDLWGNSLKQLPPEIGLLQELYYLRLSANGLEQLSPELCRLASLTSLDLSDNQLRELPREIGELKELRILNLSGNRLEYLPPALGRLKHLKKLYLTGNQLRNLPLEMGQLAALEVLELEDNPWDRDYSALIRRDRVFIRSFLKNRAREQVESFEAKLVLVGEGATGKTCLLKRLVTNAFHDNLPTTHGIEISTLELDHPIRRGQQIRLNCWDFGGQRLYHIGHQFFYSEQALYLVLWNHRTDPKMDQIEGWIKRIRSQVPHPRIMLVGTHCEDRALALDLEGLQTRFGADVILAAMMVDNQTGQGIDQLRQGLARYAVQLPHMGEKISGVQREARARLRQLAESKPTIALENLKRLFEDYGLEPEAVDDWIKRLHQLGDLVHYRQDPYLMNLVVLQPEWMTRSISYVLEDQQTVDQGGRLELEHLAQILNRSDLSGAYPASSLSFLIELMLRFGFCYQKERQGPLLVTQLVPSRPGRVDMRSFEAPPLPDMKKLRSCCTFSDIPSGLIPWLTVKTSNYTVPGGSWSQGIWLEKQDQSATACMEMVGDCRLRLSVEARDPLGFYATLRETINDLINSRWPGLRVSWVRGCNQVLEGQLCGGEFDEEYLSQLRQNRIEKTRCESCGAEVEIDALEGFQPGIGLTSLNTTLNKVLEEVRAGRDEDRQAYASMLALLKAQHHEARHGPQLFTITPREKGFNPLKTGKIPVRLSLYCEEPGFWHVVREYDCETTRDWMRKLTPYLNALRILLKLTGPISGLAGLLPDVSIGHANDPTTRVLDNLNKVMPTNFENKNPQTDTGDRIDKEVGSQLRIFHHFLKEIDPANDWGALRRVIDTNGEVLWVCPEHFEARQQNKNALEMNDQPDP